MSPQPKPSPVAQATQVEHLQERLSHYTYKPSYKMSIEPAYAMTDTPWLATPTLAITYTTINSRNLTTDMRITARFAVPSHIHEQDDLAFQAWLTTTLETLEIHEAHEWIRKDGVLILDPHKTVIP